MANYATLKAAIEAVIYENGNQEITGEVLQATLLAMVNALGANYQYVGLATPSTNPGTPDQNVFYLASTAGTYVNFGNIVLAENEVAILKYNGSWAKEISGFASAEKVRQLDQEKVEIAVGINLFNPNDPDIQTGKYLKSDGTIGSSGTGMCVSGYMPVKANTNYHLSAFGDEAVYSGTNPALCYYNANKEYISGEKGDRQYTTPANCAFIRTSFYGNSDGIMLNEGTARAPYQPYSEIGSYVDSEVVDIKENIGLEYSEITSFATKRYNLGTDGKFGSTNTYYRGVIPCKPGDKFVISNVRTNNVRYAFVTSDAGGAGDTIPVVSGTSVELAVAHRAKELVAPVGASFFIWNALPTSAFTSKVYSRRTLLRELNEAEAALKIASSCAVGFSPAIVKSADLSSDLALDDYPTANKFGDKIQFGCRVSSFTGIKICKGYQIDYSAWFEIDDTNVVLKGYSGGASTLATVAHGLTIESMLNVNINVTAKGSAILTMQTLGGTFSHEFTEWGYGVRGAVTVKNNSSTLTDCYLTASNPYFQSPVWLFGASYEGVSNARYPYWLKDMGYFNFLLNAYPGRNGANTIADLRLALVYGCPKILYYSGSNDATDEVYEENLETLAALCESLGITLVVYYKPDNKENDFTTRRAAVTALGCRIVNGYLAVQDPSVTWSEGTDTWYEGFLSSDGKHPTQLGAKALAMQFLLDIPEIMQYAKWEEKTFD